jgi:hypothetical protein
LIEDENNREEAALDFQAATCNKTLAQQTLGKSFEMKDRKEFKHCLEK